MRLGVGVHEGSGSTEKQAMQLLVDLCMHRGCDEIVNDCYELAEKLQLQRSIVTL